MRPVDRARNVLGLFLTEDALNDRRIILIGPSLCGLIIKKLLQVLNLDACTCATAASLLDRTDKVAFLATPHTGANLAVWAEIAQLVERPSAPRASLERDDPYLQDLNQSMRALNEWYCGWANEKGISHLVLRETKAVRIGGTVVKPDSADPRLHRVRVWSTDHDHISIAKPRDRYDLVYRLVKQFILDPFERPKPPVEEPSSGSRSQKTHSS